jgi:hypothetical protein
MTSGKIEDKRYMLYGMNIKKLIQKAFAKPSLEDIEAQEQAKLDSKREPRLPDVGDINDHTSQPVIGITAGPGAGGSAF